MGPKSQLLTVKPSPKMSNMHVLLKVACLTHKRVSYVLSVR